MLNLSGKIDNGTIALLSIVDQVANQMSVPYLVIGATARDMVMHYGYGAPVQRATADLDFAVQLPDWETYTLITGQLIDQGFKQGGTPQRMISPAKFPIDLVPFGEVADENLNIKWPPSGEVTMDVTGFEEACTSAMQVTVREEPLLQIPVASPQGLALLKLIAWDDRAQDLRLKDAKDIAYLLETYQNVEQVQERLYDIDGLMERYDWDIDIGSAHLLGIDAAEISNAQTKLQIVGILNKNFDAGTPNFLAEEMCNRVNDEYTDRLNLLQAFFNGFRPGHKQ